MSSLIPNLLARAVDDQIEWLDAWNRFSFSELTDRPKQAEELAMPESFDIWHAEAVRHLPHDQTAIEKLVAQREQLLKVAKLVLMKAPEGQVIEGVDYENVVSKHQEFLQGLRRVERAFNAAAAGLDQLTGLRSRAGMQEDLTREFSRFMRTNKPFCVAIMDIDHFKKINDTYGHDAGDKVLASAADHITRGIRPFDDAYRMGGEEFLLCLKETDRMTGLTILDRLRAGLEKKTVALPGGRRVNITASFGLMPSNKDVPPEAMVQKADEALYRAKNSGRNKIVISDQ